MRVGSLFAGIGGFDLGLERAGMHTVWQVEQNAYRRAVLARHWPDVVRHSDVRDVGARELAPVDLICGGFPCQDISLAGRGAGIGGARSGLWGQFARIAGELRPRYLIVENVPALTRRGLGVILGDLAALGYDAEWDCLPASAVGAPHRRDRLWLVAYPNGAALRQQPERDQPHPPERRHALAGDDGDHGAVADAPGNGAPAGQPGPGLSGPGRRRGLADGGQAVADAHGERQQGVQPRPATAGRGQPGRTGRAVADTEEHGERPGLRASQPGAQRGGRPGDGGGPPRTWPPEPDVGRVAHGVPQRVDRLAALGDALVPQLAEWLGAAILNWEASRER